MKLSPSGSWSTTVMSPATVDGPALVTVRTYVAGSPATSSPSSSFWIPRSADGSTVTRSVASSLSGFSSGVRPGDTVAVLSSSTASPSTPTTSSSRSTEITIAAGSGPAADTVAPQSHESRAGVVAEQSQPGAETELIVMPARASDRPR